MLESPRTASCRQLNREMQIAASKAGGTESHKPFDVTQGPRKFGVCSAWFQSCFNPVFSHYAPVLPCGMAIYIPPQYMLDVGNLPFVS